jgi:hypothetical protein
MRYYLSLIGLSGFLEISFVESIIWSVQNVAGPQHLETFLMMPFLAQAPPRSRHKPRATLRSG